MKYLICAASCNQVDHDNLIEKYPKLHDFNYSVVERKEWIYTIYDSYIEIDTFDDLNRLLDYTDRIVIRKPGNEHEHANNVIIIYDDYLE